MKVTLANLVLIILHMLDRQTHSKLMGSCILPHPLFHI